MIVSQVMKPTLERVQRNGAVTGTEELAGMMASPAEGGRRRDVKDGYIDVLGDLEPLAHKSHRVFNRKRFPLIYERLWRPSVSRIFFGLAGPRLRAERELTLKMLAVSSGDRVIDVGCGPGNYTLHLAEASHSGLVVGLDASEAMVATAASRGGGANLAYLRGDACALPFDDNAFDAACCVGVIHMIDRPMVALDEMVRVLAPGGRLAVVATCRRRGAAARVRRGIRFFGHDELTTAMRERGLVDIDQRVVGRAQFLSARKAEEQVGR